MTISIYAFNVTKIFNPISTNEGEINWIGTNSKCLEIQTFLCSLGEREYEEKKKKSLLDYNIVCEKEGCFLLAAGYEISHQFIKKQLICSVNIFEFKLRILVAIWNFKFK